MKEEEFGQKVEEQTDKRGTTVRVEHQLGSNAMHTQSVVGNSHN